MRSALAFALLALSLALVATAAAAAGPDVLAWTTTQRQGSSGAIEQQPGATYLGPCTWTIDSNVVLGGFGKLAAGASAATTECLIADGFSHIVGVKILSSSPLLLVTVAYAPQGRSFQLVARPVVGGYEYRGCVVGPAYSDWPSLPPVEGSEGGHGIRTDITVAVANPTSKALRDVNAFATIGNRGSGVCQALSDPYEDPAGVVWRTGL